MIKALLLVFDPVRTWDDIAQRERSLWFVLLVHLVPILALTGAAEYFALINWGKWVADVARYDLKSPDLALGYVGLQHGGSLLLVFGLAWIIRVLNRGAQGIATYRDCFVLLSYALSPLFAVRLFDVIPGVTGVYSLASLIIGGCLVLATYYSGVPRMLRLTPGSAFGQYLSGVVITLLLFTVLRVCSLVALESAIIQ